MQEIVKKIIAVEEAARGEVDAAREEGEKLIAETERQAGRLVEESEKEGKVEADKLIREARKEAEDKKRRALRIAKEEGEELRSRNHGRIDEVAADILQEVLPK